CAAAFSAIRSGGRCEFAVVALNIRRQRSWIRQKNGNEPSSGKTLYYLNEASSKSPLPPCGRGLERGCANFGHPHLIPFPSRERNLLRSPRVTSPRNFSC